MVKYRDILGYSKKQSNKKIVKEEPKQSITDLLKEEYGELNHIQEGPSYEYSKHIKKIDKLYDMYGAAVGDFQTLLKKKGLKKEAKGISMVFGKLVMKFHKTFEKMVRNLL